MALFPALPTTQQTTLMTTEFLGLNRGLSVGDGEFADMTNMTADAYPVLASRQARTAVSWKSGASDDQQAFADPQGMIGGESLVICEGGAIYVDGEKVEGIALSTEASMQPKHLVSMGAYVCIWPDKKYINLANPDDKGDMGASWKAPEGAQITAMMCRKNGAVYDDVEIHVSDTAPVEPADQDMWLDTSGDNDVLKQYSAIYDEWVQVATTYIKIQADGIGKGFREGDAIFLSGVAVAQTQAVATQAEDVTETLVFSTEGFSLKSTFRSSTQSGGKVVSDTPTKAERTKVITVEGIPDGALVTQAVLHVDAGSSMYGARVLTANGKVLVTGHNEIPMTVNGNGDVSIKFVFQSNNTATTAGQHAGQVNFTDIHLDVTYAVAGSDDGGTVVDESIRKQIELLNTSNILYAAGDDYIVVAGLIRGNVTLDNGLLAELRVPDFDYVCEANNRIWGCTFTKADGVMVNELRACALGDFRNWHLYAGTSMDSYAVSVGSDGVFTGAFSMAGSPIFFKENVMHRVSGTQPSNFALNSLMCRGVQEGCWRSLTQVGEVLYYKARTDVMAYDGSLPYSVSEKLGNARYFDAAGGTFRDKLYMSMRDGDMAWSLYVFDTRKGLWHREDDAKVRFFASVRGDMYFIREGEDSAAMWSVNGLTDDPEPPFEWSATFGVYGYAYEGQKYLSRFNIRAQLAAKQYMTIEIMYDSDGIWVNEGTFRCPVLRTVMIPVIPRRCDHCQIRLSGKGDVKIFSVARILEQGGDG